MRQYYASTMKNILITVLACLCIAAQAQKSNSEWKFECQRPEIAPVYAVDDKVMYDGKPTLTLKGGGKDYAAGYWYKVVSAEPGAYYHFQTFFKSSGVDEPDRSVLARVLWQ